MSGINRARGFTNRSRPTGYLKSVLELGIGRHVPQLKRLTLKFCDVSKDSMHARQFVEERLIDFASKHPSVVVYALPETYAEPQVCAEYLNGREEIKELRKLQSEEILDAFETFTRRSGVEIIHIFKDFTTQYHSVQGQWHPFVHKKDYDITKPLDFSVKLHNAWDPIGDPWKRFYRRRELSRMANRLKLTLEEKSDLPLGKWGPTLPPSY